MLKCALLPALAATLLSQDAQFGRAGDYFVHTVDGTAALMPQARLHVMTRGHVILRGYNGTQMTFRLTERVKARSEADARRMFGSVRTSTISRPSMTTLEVTPASAPNVIIELEIKMPRRVMMANLATRLGDIEAYDLEGSLHAETTGGLIRCDRIHGAVSGRTGGGEIRMGKIGGAVQLLNGAGSIFLDSAGAEANCQTAGGQIVVREAAGPLVLSTEGGNIQVDKAASTVQAHTGEGVIEIFQAGGAVFADTRGGSIQVGSARGVKCESAAGAIRVKTSSSPLRVQTAMGSILAELLAGAQLEESSLIASAGDITVLIPSNLALSVLARNDTGGNPRIVSDFAEVQPRRVGPMRPPTVAEGAINGGGPVMRINVAGGTIYLRRLK